MKTIVENSTKISKYLLSDTSTISSSPECLFVNQDDNLFLINDLNSTTTTITENVTNAPSDWVGNRYKFDGTNWSENPDWIEGE